MKIRLNPPSIDHSIGFTPETDIFELSGFGKQLSRLVDGIEMPATIVLNGDWGTGKSTFIKQWAATRKSDVIYLDAFSSDYLEDAFLFLTSGIANSIVESPGSAAKVKDFREKATTIAVKFLPIGLNVAVRAATAGLLDKNQIQDAGAAAAAIVQGTSEASSKMIQRSIEQRIVATETDKVAIESFQNTLAELAAKKPSTNSESDADATSPLVIIIDELDRCRPTFAVDVLESIKHLFSVQNVCFILVSNFGQLESAIRSQYGNGIDAATYLQKFHDFTLSLPVGEKGIRSNRRRYVNFLLSSVITQFNHDQYGDSLSDSIGHLAEAHALSYRDIDLIARHWKLFLISTTNDFLRPPPLVSGLLLMKLKDRSLYQRAKHGEMVWDQYKKFLRLDLFDESSNPEWFEKWWVYASSESLPEEDWVSNFESGLGRYHFPSRSSILPNLINSIDQISIPET